MQQAAMEAAAEGKWSTAGLGRSLRVQNVQPLAARLNGETPNQYIRPEIKDEQVRAGDLEDVPVIDFSRLRDEECSQVEAAKLSMACEGWGFFQLINHGVSGCLIERVKADVMEFFNLPLQQKEEVAHLPNSVEGYGQAFVIAEDQKPDWSDTLNLLTQPSPRRTMRFWPTHPPTFRETFDSYSQHLKKVSDSLIGFMAKNLGLDPPEKLTKIFEEGRQSLRMNYYPPSPDADKVLGISPHTDAVGLTLLLQVNDVQGLQIRRKGGWLSINPIPHAFIVNIGDVMEILSNGKYKSIEHRVLVNPQKERLSIAGFHNLDFGHVVGPIAELVHGGEEHYKSLRFEDYMKKLYSNKLGSKSFLNQMRLEK